MQTNHLDQSDRQAHLRALYQSLLVDQERFDEFKQLLSSYPASLSPDEPEPAEAASVRERLNVQIRAWTGVPNAGLSSQQAQLWRAIVVDERFNIALSPWKEANGY